jgi:hypothetical protein
VLPLFKGDDYTHEYGIKYDYNHKYGIKYNTINTFFEGPAAKNFLSGKTKFEFDSPTLCFIV